MARDLTCSSFPFKSFTFVNTLSLPRKMLDYITIIYDTFIKFLLLINKQVNSMPFMELIYCQNVSKAVLIYLFQESSSSSFKSFDSPLPKTTPLRMLRTWLFPIQVRASPALLLRLISRFLEWILCTQESRSTYRIP
jgi:hypothetical protein